MFDRKTYKKQAREQLKNHWKVPLLIGLVTLGFSVVLCIVVFLIQFNQMVESVAMIALIEETSAMSRIMSRMIVIALVIYSIYGIIYMATSHFYLSFAKDNKNSTFSTFLEGFALWSKGARGFLWMCLWIVLWFLVFIIPMCLVMMLLTPILDVVMRLFSSNIATVTVLMVFAMFFMMFLIYSPIIIKAITYSQMFFVIADNPKVGVCRAMRISKAMTKGHIGEMFVMSLSFLGWILLAILPYFIAVFTTMVTMTANMDMTDIYSLLSSILSWFLALGLFYIAWLWIGPYIATSFTYAYNYMKQDAVNRKVLTYADFGQKDPVLAVEGELVGCPVITGPSVEETPNTEPTIEKPAIEEPTSEE